jgi:hypothetical protein
LQQIVSPRRLQDDPFAAFRRLNNYLTAMHPAQFGFATMLVVDVRRWSTFALQQAMVA